MPGRKFARSSNWLKTIFPPSSTPGGRDAGFVSEDVQLVQTYADGVAFTREDQFVRFFSAQNNPGANNGVTLLTTAPDQFFRLISASSRPVTAPVANTTIQLEIRYAPVTVNVLAITDLITFAAGASGIRFPWPMDKTPVSTIIPPNHEIRFRQGPGGDPLNTFTFDLPSCVACTVSSSEATPNLPSTRGLRRALRDSRPRLRNCDSSSIESTKTAILRLKVCNSTSSSPTLSSTSTS